jgi:formylglycine-generating enzyme required for sulfatase activity
MSGGGPAAAAGEDVVRILFLGANPSGTTRLALDREVRAITQRLRASPHGHRFVLAQEWAVRVSDLQAALLRHQPHVLHFSGHGLRAATDDAPTTEGHRNVLVPGGVPEGGAIVVEDDRGKAAPIDAEALEALLGIVGSVRCVVLNACHSATQSAALRRQVPCVVGMDDTIQDTSAIAFAWAFYQGLGYGKTVRGAFDLGRNEIALEKLPGKDIPTLSADEELHLVEPPRPPPPPHRWPLVAGAVAIAALGGGLAYWLATRPAVGPSSADARPAAADARAIADAAVVPPTPPPGMVWIPAAQVTLGTPEAELADLRARCTELAGAETCAALERAAYWSGEPVRTVDVPGFFLDATEVTLGDFAAWIERRGPSVAAPLLLIDGVAVARTGPVRLSGGRVRVQPGLAGRAAVEVTWDGARAYCDDRVVTLAAGDQRHAALPTPDQWERAARGRGTRFPWGDTPPTCTDAILAAGGTCPGAAEMKAPRSAPGDRTPEGVFDLAGNVAEWVADDEATAHEVRGGSYGTPWLFARGASRRYARTEQSDVGFRCAVSP